MVQGTVAHDTEVETEQPNAMTIRQKIEETLVDHGLWEDEAKTIVTEAEKEKSLEAMQGRWDEDTAAYTAPLLAVTWMSVKHHATEWLKANKPQHFALAMLSA